MGFGKWLGEENGKNMIAEIMSQYNCTPDQARAVITTYCLLFDIEVDTRRWDYLISWAENYNSWFSTYDEFDNFMCGLLI